MGVLLRSGADHQPGRRKRRLWVVTPAPQQLWRPFEGAWILDELQSPLGLYLCCLYRDVRLWTSTRGPNRYGLFAEQDRDAYGLSLPETAQEFPDLLRAVRALTFIAIRPDLIDSGSISDACRGVAEWAIGQGFPLTALAFAEVAASIQPRDADAAFNSGRVARRVGFYERAAQWFDRAMCLARRASDPAGYADALLGWGNMEFQRGNHSQARSLFIQAWRAAKKAKIRRLGAAAHHNLLLLTIELGDWEAAETHAALAFNLYRRTDPRIPYLAHDTAHLWMWQEYHAAALPIFREVLAFITAPSEQIQVWANIARTTAALRRADDFFAAWQEVDQRSTRPSEFLAVSLALVAEGARTLGLTSQAFDIATRALAIATQRQETGAAKLAQDVLTSIRDGKPGLVAREPPTGVHQLAQEMLAILRQFQTAAP